MEMHNKSMEKESNWARLGETKSVSMPREKEYCKKEKEKKNNAEG